MHACYPNSTPSINWHSRVAQDGTFVRTEKQEEKTIVELRQSFRTTAVGGRSAFAQPAVEDEGEDEDEDEELDEDGEDDAYAAAYAAERRAAAAAAEPPAKRHKPEEVEEGGASAGPCVAETEDEGLFDDEDDL